MAVGIRGTTPAVFTSTTATVGGTVDGTRQPQTNDVLLIIHGNDFFELSNMVTPTVGGSTSGVNAITGGAIDGGSNQAHIKAYTKVITSGGSDLAVSTTETGSADEEKGLAVFVLTGVDTTTPIDVSAAGNTDNTAGQTDHVAPSISPPSAAFLICHVNMGGGIGGTYTPPSGMSEVYDTNVASAMGFSAAVLQLSASGATGTKTFVASIQSSYATISIAIRAASTGLTGTVTQVTETDTAQAITPKKFKLVGQVTETDIAQALVHSKVKLVGQVTEVDTSRGIVRVKLRTIGQATETDTARPVTVKVVRLIGQALETDTARALLHVLSATIGQVVETDVAQGLTRRKIRTVGQVTETDLARVVTSRKVRTVGQVTESNTAQPITPPGTIAVGVDRCTETNLAQSVTHTKRTIVGQCVETNVAQPLSHKKATIVSQCIEADLARPVAALGGASVINQVTETDTAQPLGHKKTLVVARVTEVDLARQILRAQVKAIGQCTETDTAQGIARQVKSVVLGRVTEFDLARRIFVRGDPDVGFVGRHVAYLAQKTVGGNAQYVKRRSATVTGLATDTNPRLRVGHTGEVYGNASTGIQERTDPDANDTGVYVRY